MLVTAEVVVKEGGCNQRNGEDDSMFQVMVCIFIAVGVGESN